MPVMQPDEYGYHRPGDELGIVDTSKCDEEIPAYAGLEVAVYRGGGGIHYSTAPLVRDAL